MNTSIVIPTYNGGELLRRTLKAIFAQQTTKSFEVVVIDSGSKLDTKQILAEFPIKLIEIPNSEFNHGLTRDLGAESASGEFLIFINQDAEPGDSQWLELMLAPFVDRNILAVQGGIRERHDMRRFFWDSCGETFYFTSESKNWIRQHFNMGFSTVNCAIRRSQWQLHPFGKMDIFEDKGFQGQVHRKGDEIVYSDGFVYHTHDYTYDQLKHRCQDEGYGWKLVGENYSLLQAIKDIFILKNYTKLIRGILKGKVQRWSEVIFPILRPIWIYKGNHLNQGLLKR
jgi:rhamnosyltransferase